MKRNRSSKKGDQSNGVETQDSHLLHGLSYRAKLILIAVSLGIAITSLVVSWVHFLMFAGDLRYDASDVETLKQIHAIAPSHEVAQHGTLVHGLNVQAHVKNITNLQGLAVLAAGGGYAMLAIGLCLLILGVDGAFRLEMTGKGTPTMMLQSSTPGVLCLVAATILIIVAATRSYDLKIGEYDVSPPNEAAQAYDDPDNQSQKAPTVAASTAEKELELIKSSRDRRTGQGN